MTIAGYFPKNIITKVKVQRHVLPSEIMACMSSEMSPQIEGVCY